jgi:hypothetical protein
LDPLDSLYTLGRLIICPRPIESVETPSTPSDYRSFITGFRNAYPKMSDLPPLVLQVGGGYFKSESNTGSEKKL